MNTSEQFNIIYIAKTLNTIKQKTVKMAYSVLHQSMPTGTETRVRKYKKI